MASYAVIGPDSTVVNVVVWDGVTDWPHDEVVVDLTDWTGVGIGWDYVDGEFVDNRPEPEPEPED